jgi:hypothetical protein
MATQNEYAALAAIVYNDQRGGGGDAVTNTLRPLAGWQDLSRLGFAAGDNLNRNPFSFTGGAYLNQSTGEIVIAYKGTDFLVEFSGRAWNTLADLVTDAGLALAKKSVGLYNLQQIAASSYYLAVRDWALQNGHDPNKISFTGHSLGGGYLGITLDKTQSVALIQGDATHSIADCALFTPAKTLKGFKDARKNHRSCAKLRAKLATRRRNHCAGSYEKRSDSIYKHRTSRP